MSKYYCVMCDHRSDDDAEYVGESEHLGMGPDLCLRCFLKHPAREWVPKVSSAVFAAAQDDILHAIQQNIKDSVNENLQNL